MKKGMKPQLDPKWWAKNKPVFLGKTGLGAALKDYVIARDKFDHDGALKALDAVRKKVGFVIGKCANKTHKTTRDVLYQYQDVIVKARKDLDAKIDAAQKSAAAAAVPDQKIGPGVVIWKRDIGAMIVKKSPPEWIGKLEGFVLEQRLNGDILDVFEEHGDFVTPQQIVEDSEEIGQKIIAACVSHLKSLDRLIRTEKLTDTKKIVASVEKNLGDSMLKAQKLLEQLPKKRWDKFVAQKKEYKKYKIKTGVKLTTGTVGITAGVGGLALGIAGAAGAVPSMGATLAIAIPGMVAGLAGTLRSCAAMTKQLVDLSRSAEKVQRDLAKDLMTLKKRYENACKAKVVAGETAASTVKGILGTDTPFLATIPKCNDNYGLLEGKTGGISVTLRKLSKQVMKALKETEAIEKSLKSLKDAKARKAYDKLVKTRKALSEALDKCSDMGGRLTKLEKVLPKMGIMMKALNDKNPMFNKIFDQVFPIVVSGTLIATGAGTSFGDAGSIADFVTTGVGLVTDITLEVADFATDKA